MNLAYDEDHLTCILRVHKDGPNLHHPLCPEYDIVFYYYLGQKVIVSELLVHRTQ